MKRMVRMTDFEIADKIVLLCAGSGTRIGDDECGEAVRVRPIAAAPAQPAKTPEEA